MQTDRFFWPIFSYIKVKFPNAIIQVRFDGLLKLQETEQHRLVGKLYYVYGEKAAAVHSIR